MRYATMMAIGAAALAAATAGARAPEARNPFHCSIALQISYEVVKDARGVDSPLAKELHSRLAWQAFAAARFPKATDSDAQADALRKQFLDDAEGGIALAEACMKRQDAHPAFREARLEKQLQGGLDQEPLSVHAGIQELRGLMRSNTPTGRQ